MAGFKDVVEEDGSLVNPTQAKRPEKPFEVVEEMYGMIWFMSTFVVQHFAERGIQMTNEEAINFAREQKMTGLRMSPTTRFPLKE